MSDPLITVNLMDTNQESDIQGSKETSENVYHSRTFSVFPFIINYIVFKRGSGNTDENVT